MRAVLLAALLCLLPACSGDDDDGVSVDGAARVVDGGASVDGAAGLKAFGASCSTGPECASGLCFNFNMNGPHCTKPCTAATAAADCAPATFGCSGMNVCKIR